MMLKNNNSNFQKGASLTEIAIVISIISLITLLVTSGINIRKASQLRSFISDVNSFQISIESFVSKYSELPGDMTDAVDYWSINTQNGDGDDQIEYPNTGNMESLRAWQHLNLAGFVEGWLTGVATNNNQADIGINVPKANRVKVGYYLVYQDSVGAGSRNEIVLGAFNIDNPNNNSSLSPIEAKTIDMKLDDGNPTRGVVYGYNGSDAGANNCRNGANDAYLLTNEEVSCVLSFNAEP